MQRQHILSIECLMVQYVKDYHKNGLHLCVDFKKYFKKFLNNIISLDLQNKSLLVIVTEPLQGTESIRKRKKYSLRRIFTSYKVWQVCVETL